MKVRIKYFGMIAEKTGKSEELLDLPGVSDSQSLSEMLKKQYHLDHIPFRVAVNKKVEEKSQSLQDADEVALLPPYAGG